MSIRYAAAIAAAALLSVPGLSIAADGQGAEKHPGKAPNPCHQIEQACTAAGFVPGGAKAGKGLGRDCVNPIMQSKPAPAGVTLPSVDPAVVSACKAKNPRFGLGPIGAATPAHGRKDAQ